MTDPALAWGPGLTVGRIGDVTVGHEEGPYLAPYAPRLILGDEGAEEPEWSPPREDRAPDEVTVVRQADGVTFGVRHHIEPETWDLRVWLRNGRTSPITLDRCVLALNPAPREYRPDGAWPGTIVPNPSVGWVWPAASAGLIALAADGALIGLRVRQGELLSASLGLPPDIDPAGLSKLRPPEGFQDEWLWLDGGTTLLPGQQAVFALQGRLYDSWAAVGGLVPAWLPPLSVAPDAVIEIDRPDAIVTAPAALEADDLDGRTFLRGEGPVKVTLTQNNKRVTLDAAFAFDVPGRTAELACDWTSPYLPDLEVATGLVVAAHWPAWDEGWDEVTGTLAERAWERLGRLAQGREEEVYGETGLLLAGLAATGQDVAADTTGVVAEALEFAHQRVGLGLAVAELSVAGLLRERDLGPVQALVDQIDAWPAGRDWLAELEWDAALGRVPAQSELTKLMLLLGAGLPGALVCGVSGVPSGDESVARAVAVASLLGDRAQLAGDWPTTLGQAAELARWKVLAKFATDLTPVAWLALAPT
ncbi:MAG: hypothetical protein LBR33_03480 [Propionibacteriaceae bacterium]|nr:hypothetical protein [Propionibacteriaceae bacterium]